MRIPPPLLFLATFLVGVGLQRWAPLPLFNAQLAVAARVSGAALIGAGLLLMLTAAALFLRRRTTLVPFGTSAQLVTSGPYRFTRNPMYLGLSLIHLGAGGWLAQPWALLLLPLPVLFLDRLLIPFEEARLQGSFGPTFTRYRERVRRWL